MNRAIFDIGVRKSNKFNQTHGELWECVSCEWKFGKNVSRAIHNLKFPYYNKLPPPSGVNNKVGITNESKLGVAMYLWNKDMYINHDAKNIDQANIWRVYGVNIRQCIEELCFKLEAKDRYEEITSSGDVIELLKNI